MTEDIFDMCNCNVKILKEFERKQWGMFILWYVFGQLSSVKRLAYGTYAIPDICSDASRGTGLLESLENLSQNEKQNMSCAQMLHI